jgi:DNA-binding NarL/FixJ family response regulator
VTTRVLLADDQALIRAGVVMLLETEPDIEVVGQAENGVQAVELARALEPDVVLMDVRMPEMDGVEATRQITADAFTGGGRSIVVLILTTYRVDEAVYAALRAGASGFLLKDSAPQEMVTAVRALHNGDGWLDPAVTKSLITEFAARPEPDGPRPAEVAALTARECEVLVLAAQGLSNTEIAHRLYVGEATVKTHIGRVLMKLGVRDRVQAVVVAYQSGLVPVPSAVGAGAPAEHSPR